MLARRGSSLGRSRSTYVGQKFPELRALVCQRLSAELPFLVSPVGRSGGLGAWVSLIFIKSKRVASSLPRAHPALLSPPLLLVVIGRYQQLKMCFFVVCLNVDDVKNDECKYVVTR